jgi:hypothetical protein
VKGRHITKSSPAPSPVASQPSNGKQNKGHNKPGPPAVNPPGSGPIATGPTGAPAGVPSPAPSVPVQHVVAVTAADLPVEDAPVTKGSDFMTYTWDAQGGYISTSTSTRSFNSKDVSVTGILSNSSGAIHVKVAIKNLTPAKRVTATGRIRLAITGSGIAETLSSPPIDMTLTPGGTAHLEFDYALPSGTYGTNFSFVPTTR